MASENKYGTIYDNLYWEAFKNKTKDMMDKRDELEKEAEMLSDKITKEMETYNNKRNKFIKTMIEMENKK